MNRNIFIALLIFLVPLCAYWGLSKDRTFLNLPSVASQGSEIIKFSSPMCYECQELEKVFEETYPKYVNKIMLKKIDVTQKDKNTKSLIREYNIKLVPTTIFKDNNGKITRRIEGTMQPKILENYIKEAING